MFWSIFSKNKGLIKSFNPLVFNKKVHFANHTIFKVKDYFAEFLDEVNRNKVVFGKFDSICKDYDLPFYKDLDVKNSLFIIQPKLCGRELAKSCSFLTQKNGDDRCALFEVLNGEGYFILESLTERKHINLVKVKKGDRVFVPKGFTFVMINSSNNKSFVCFSLIGKDSNFKQSVLKNFSGASLYFTKNGFIKNQNAKCDYILNEFEGDFIGDFAFDKELGLYKESLLCSDKFNFLDE